MKIHFNEKPIAILLAVYNGAKYINEQIDSIINQTNLEWTLYIRDDNSSDETKDIIAEYAAKYSNILLINDGDGNLGCRGNFFRLLEVVESDYYMFSDADDVWFNNKVQLSIDELRKFEANTDLPIIVHTDYTVTDSNLDVLIESYWTTTKFKPERFYSYNLISIANPVGGSMMIFNKCLKAFIFPLANNTLLHDRWIPMVAAKHKTLFIPLYVPTKFYRMHENNFYGVKTSKSNGYYARILEIIRNNHYVANKLRTAGYGSFLKYLLFKSLYMIKGRL